MHSTAFEQEPCCGPSTRLLLNGAVTLVGSTIGAGLVALPLAFQEAGLAAATMFLVGAVGLTLLSLWFGIRAASISGARTYGELGAVVGARAWLATEFILALILFGVVTSLVILCHDCLSDGISGLRDRFSHSGSSEQTDENHPAKLGQSEIILAAAMGAVALPLSAVKTISVLQHSSVLSLLALLFVVSLVLAEGAQHAGDKGAFRTRSRTTADGVTSDSGGYGVTSEQGRWSPFSSEGLLAAAPVIVYALGCQVQAVPIFAELPRALQRPWLFARVTLVAAVSTCFGLFWTFSVAGVVGFPGSFPVEGDIIRELGHRAWSSIIGRLLLAFSVLLVQPLLLWPARTAAVAVWTGVRNGACGSVTSGDGSGVTSGDGEQHEEDCVSRCCGPPALHLTGSGVTSDPVAPQDAATSASAAGRASAEGGHSYAREDALLEPRTPERGTLQLATSRGAGAPAQSPGRMGPRRASSGSLGGGTFVAPQEDERFWGFAVSPHLGSRRGHLGEGLLGDGPGGGGRLQPVDHPERQLPGAPPDLQVGPPAVAAAVHVASGGVTSVRPVGGPSSSPSLQAGVEGEITGDRSTGGLGRWSNPPAAGQSMGEPGDLSLKGSQAMEQENQKDEEEESCTSGLPRRAGISLVLLGLAYAVAIAVPSITVVFRVLGSTGACYLFFIYPTGVFLLLDARRRWRAAREQGRHPGGVTSGSVGGATSGGVPLLLRHELKEGGTTAAEAEGLWQVGDGRDEVDSGSGSLARSDALDDPESILAHGERAAAWCTLVCGVVIGVSSTYQVAKDLS